MDITRTEEVRRTIQDLFEQILAEENIVLSRPERARLFEQIAAEILGFGPLQPLLEDDTITEIMVNGPKNVYIERKGKLHRVPVTFESNDHVMRVIDRIVAPLGRRIDESSPYVDARLPDGSRVNAIIPPISLVGPTLTIRKFSKNPITVEQLIQFGSISNEVVQFLKACVELVPTEGGVESALGLDLSAAALALPDEDGHLQWSGPVEDDTDLVVSASSADRWTLTVDGESQPQVTPFGWSTGFEVTGAGTARLEYDTSSVRYGALALQVLAWVLVLRALLHRRLRARRADTEPSP
jgi:hypothetical protein